MADLQGRPEELQLRARLSWLACLLSLTTVPVSPVYGQEAAPDEPGQPRPYVEASFGAAHLHGDAVAMVGGMVGLRLGRSWSLGGGGFFAPRPVPVGEVLFRDLEMQVGYGGLLVEWAGASDPGPRFFGRALLGAGNVDIRDRDTGVMSGSDNHVFFEPEVGVSFPVRGDIAVRASGSFRIVAGVEDLDGVETSDLGGLGVRIGLSFSPG